jgi:hypothetical protein
VPNSLGAYKNMTTNNTEVGNGQPQQKQLLLLADYMHYRQAATRLDMSQQAKDPNQIIHQQ